MLLLPAAAILHAADISGAWTLKVISPEGEHQAKLTLAQSGEKLSGAVNSPRGDYKLDGAVKGDQVEFTVHYTGGDTPMSIPFQGKVEGNKMTGQYKTEDTTGSWTAEKAGS